jgi:alpha-tubulin suppressor-like RCC1 family protein
METLLSSRRRHYLASVGIFLVAVAFVAGMIGCGNGGGGDGEAEYTAMVAAGEFHTVGLKSSGTVVAVGDNSDGQCDVGDWTDIVQVAAGFVHTVGLNSDGTVVAVGHSGYGQCDVGNWTDIIQVAAGDYHTVGLRSDGTVVAAGMGAELRKWNLGGATS